MRMQAGTTQPCNWFASKQASLLNSDLQVSKAHTSPPGCGASGAPAAPSAPASVPAQLPWLPVPLLPQPPLLPAGMDPEIQDISMHIMITKPSDGSSACCRTVQFEQSLTDTANQLTPLCNIVDLTCNIMLSCTSYCCAAAAQQYSLQAPAAAWQQNQHPVPFEGQPPAS